MSRGQSPFHLENQSFKRKLDEEMNAASKQRMVLNSSNSENTHPNVVPQRLIIDGSYGGNMPPRPSSAASQHSYTAKSADNAPMEERESRLKVVVRIRPPIREDVENVKAEQDLTVCTQVEGSNKIHINRPLYEDKEFKYDCVLPADCDQETMYRAVAEDKVEDVLNGFNATILAYGQTGTGKTYTIFGPGCNWEIPSTAPVDDGASDGGSFDAEEFGVIPRAVFRLFDHVEAQRGVSEFRITVSFLQIYMETIVDLLDPKKNNLSIREDPKAGVFVEGQTCLAVGCPEDVLDLIQEGHSNRATSYTLMNKESSRSHVILMVGVEQRPYRSSGASNAVSSENARVKRGLLSIVDLAGSERVSKSGSKGVRLEEAKKINRSLCALGKCVAALSDNSNSHVPFRDSKLTRLLTESLGGNSKTCLCATVGPALFNYDETHSTLLFAQRAMRVRTKPRVNEVDDFKALSKNLQDRLAALEQEREELVQRNVTLDMQVNAMHSELSNIKTQVQSNGPSESQWQARERQLVAKFTEIIHQLQMEIARQTQQHDMQLQESKQQQDELQHKLEAAYQERAALHGQAESQDAATVEAILDVLLRQPSLKHRLEERMWKR